MNNAPRILIGSYCIFLAACTDNNKDLTHYIQQVKQRKSPMMEPLPLLDFKSNFTYLYDKNKRNPFKQSKQKKRELLFAYKTRKIKHLLEKYDLHTLKFAGTIMHQQQRWGLIKGPDSQITSVHIGDYLGKNHGRISAIQHNLIQIKQTIKDSWGGRKKQVNTFDLRSDR